MSVTDRDSINEILSTWDLDINKLAGQVDSIGENSCIILGGSIVEGTSTKYSDIDLMAIGPVEELASLDAGRVRIVMGGLPMLQAELGAGAVQIEIRDADFIEGMKKKMLPQFDILKAGNYEGCGIITAAEHRFMNRLMTGVPLINSEMVVQLRQDLQVTNLPMYLAFTFSIEIGQHYDDFLGAVQTGDNETVVLMLRMLMSDLGGYLLALNGNCCEGEKWRAKLLRLCTRDDNADLIENVVDLMFIKPCEVGPNIVNRVNDIIRAIRVESKKQFGNVDDVMNMYDTLRGL